MVKKLVLTIVYSRDGVLPEEPPFQYIPADVSPTSRLNGQCDPLDESMMLLNEGLVSGNIVLQFEVSLLSNNIFKSLNNRYSQQLYRKKLGESMSAARMSDNLSKNRYRDISPCESS